MRALKPWGVALLNLMAARGRSKREVTRAADMERSQLTRICYSQRGPTLDVLGRLLATMEVTWEEWGLELDRAMGAEHQDTHVKRAVGDGERRPKKKREAPDRLRMIRGGLFGAILTTSYVPYRTTLIVKLAITWAAL